MIPFVLENNFEDASRPEIMELLTRYRYQGITVLQTGDPAVIYERFKNRNAIDDRHPRHVYDDIYPRIACEEHPVPVQKSREQYLSDVEICGYNRFRANGPCIEVDVNDFDQLNYAAVLSAIRGAISNSTYTNLMMTMNSEKKVFISSKNNASSLCHT